MVSWPPPLLHQGADLHFEKWSQGSGRQLPATSGGAQIHLLEKWLQLSRGREGRGGGDSSMRNGYKSHIGGRRGEQHEKWLQVPQSVAKMLLLSAEWDSGINCS